MPRHLYKPIQSTLMLASIVVCGLCAAQAPSAPAEKPAANINPPAEDRSSAGAVVQERKADVPGVELPSRAAADPVAPPAAMPASPQPSRKPSGKLKRVEDDIKRGTHNRV